MRLFLAAPLLLLLAGVTPASDVIRLGGSTNDLAADNQRLIFDGNASTDLTRGYWGGGYRGGWGGWGGGYRGGYWGGYRGGYWGGGYRGYNGWGVGHRGYWGGGYRPFYGAYYGGYRPSWGGSYYVPSTVYYGSYYNPCVDVIETPTVRLFQETPTTPQYSPAPQQFQQETNFRYDGGPTQVLPMPVVPAAQDQMSDPQRPYVPRSGLFVSLPNEMTGFVTPVNDVPERKAAKANYTYPAYGESR